MDAHQEKGRKPRARPLGRETLGDKWMLRERTRARPLGREALGDKWMLRNAGTGKDPKSGRPGTEAGGETHPGVVGTPRSAGTGEAPERGTRVPKRGKDPEGNSASTPAR